MKHSLAMTVLMGILSGAAILCSALPAQADNTGVQAALVSRPELSMFLQALHESGVANELKQDQTYTVFAPINEAFAKVVVADSSCPESAECRTQMAAIVRNHIVPVKARIDVLAKQQGGVGTLGVRPLHIEAPAQPHEGHKVDGFKIVGMHETEAALVYNIEGSIVTEQELGAMNAIDKGSSAAQDQDAPADKPRGNAAMAPIIPARPSLVAPPTR